MRRLVAAALVLLLAFVLVGCGGGDEEQSGEVTTQTDGGAPPAPAASDEEIDPAANYTRGTEEMFEAFPDVPEITPEEILTRLESQTPMMLYFFDASQKMTEDQDDQISVVMNDYRGLIDLVSYDIGKFAKTQEDGTVVIDPAILEDETATDVQLLASEDVLNITFTPTIIMVNGDGYMTYRARGPVDSKLLEQQVIRATD